MAITIRDTEKHQEMLAALKQLTGKGTQSGALIEGGYTAIRYHGMYEAEALKNRQLENELYRLKLRVSAYFDALDSLRETCEH
ncbi:hypothetical protein [Photobacterium sp. J15]|uniref:hypothetical protein n=1 Tax=Photobacterium sp. J15 TaxID=265901 RepID=UPI0007E4B18B|nr:hypothetical protein [Photobacterium sp. J15]